MSPVVHIGARPKSNMVFSLPYPDALHPSPSSVPTMQTFAISRGSRRQSTLQLHTYRHTQSCIYASAVSTHNNQSIIRPMQWKWNLYRFDFQSRRKKLIKSAYEKNRINQHFGTGAYRCSFNGHSYCFRFFFMQTSVWPESLFSVINNCSFTFYEKIDTIVGFFKSISICGIVALWTKTNTMSVFFLRRLFFSTWNFINEYLTVK